MSTIKKDGNGIDVNIVNQSDSLINGMKAHSVSGVASSDQGKALAFVVAGIVSNDGKGGALLTMYQSDKDDFDYSNDFAKVCNSVRYDEAKADAGSTSQAQPQEPKQEEPKPEESKQEEPKPEEPASTDAVSPEFKASMDSYEAFFDEYVDFMRRYKENPTDMELLAEAGNMLSREADMIREFDKIENQDLNAAEMAYYLEVHARIYKKLAEVL